MTFNKYKYYHVEDRNEFLAVILQGDAYFLVDLDTGNSVPIVDCEDMEEAIEKYGDKLEALNSQGAKPKGKLVPTGDAPKSD